MSREKELVVLALGGNALIRRGQKGAFKDQLANLKRIAPDIARLARKYTLLITHGNGPQVGALSLQQEVARDQVPPQPLHVCVAMTQAQIGYMIQLAISDADPSLTVAVVLTRVLVDLHDPAFEKPSKPIGPYYDREEAELLEKEMGWVFARIPGRGYRRVVPSPRPLEVIDIRAIESALEACDVVVAGGGGGIPVTLKGKGLVGVDAVIDKDLTSSLLARTLRATKFVILTDVDAVYINYGTPNAQPLRRVTPSVLRKYLKEGHFPPGSMGPKVEAVIEFVEATGKAAAIGHLDEMHAVVEGEKGTLIRP